MSKSNGVGMPATAGRKFAPLVIRLTWAEMQSRMDILQCALEAASSQFWQSGFDEQARAVRRIALQIAAMKKRVTR